MRAGVIRHRRGDTAEVQTTDPAYVYQRSGPARLFAGLWLTACTYPIVVLVLYPLLVTSSRTIYLVVAETFAPVGECLLFWLAYGKREEVGERSMWRDFATIIIANLASFGAGEVLNAYRWFGLLG